MKQIIKFIILFNLTVFSILQVNPLVAQNYEETLQFAENQFANKNYDIALKTFKRLLFFNEDGNNVFLYKQVAEIALLQEDYETAQFNFGLASGNATTDSAKIDFLFKKAYSQILDKKYNFAIIDLFSIDDSNENIKMKLNFYLGTCYFGLEEFEKSKSYFKHCLDSNSYPLLNEIFNDNNLYYPSPKKAKILSIILPGLGQFYTHNFKEGFNSFFLTIGLLSLGAYNAITVDPLFGIISTLPWIQRYYEGGYGNAEKLAKIKRQKNRNKTYNKTIELIHFNSEN